ncbi:SprT family protein [Terribacillus saccharophilus]|uniref:SprT family protein n=1 Tax=Terribacillus saccharophilus TaxID=361277 RepID=A0A268A7U0_9BACI|nr:SprT family protein [Terribacillus saccharophilus]PAD20195.1 SprT family protein [Terribacillus saccharophilus]PAF20870.1 SprT family protein [Terribacillus saccharophilus]
MKEITMYNLQQIVEEISIELFNRPFVDTARYNNRLRTTGGRYLPGKRIIEINPKYLQELGQEETIGIIKHELCHYHLHIEGKGYGHRDSEFRELLQQTDSPRFCNMLPSVKEKTLLYYKCTKCGHVYKRKKIVNTRKYGCGKCGGKLKKQENTGLLEK